MPNLRLSEADDGKARLAERCVASGIVVAVDRGEVEHLAVGLADERKLGVLDVDAADPARVIPEIRLALRPGEPGVLSGSS
jgi:hypothetical protein